MNNIENNIETQKSLSEQREELLQLNLDLLAGVYSLKNTTDQVIDLELEQDMLACYPNQLENLTGLEFNPDIKIVNLATLRKGDIQSLHGEVEETNKNLVLLSNGVIDYVEGSGLQSKKHLILTLRDGGAADTLSYTSTAGRNTGENLKEEVERELYEEAPFLGRNDNGEYVLAIPAGNDEGKEYTISSIKNFLQTKYNLDSNNEDDLFFIKQFERNFQGIKYSELGTILEEIIRRDNFVNYDWEKGDIPELSDDMKTISVGGHAMDAFVFYDEDNNTIEYRDIRKIKGVPDGFTPISNRPSRLYLESQNQAPIYSRLGKNKENVTPTIYKVNNEVKETLNIHTTEEFLSNAAMLTNSLYNKLISEEEITQHDYKIFFEEIFTGLEVLELENDSLDQSLDNIINNNGKKKDYLVILEEIFQFRKKHISSDFEKAVTSTIPRDLVMMAFEQGNKIEERLFENLEEYIVENIN